MEVSFFFAWFDFWVGVYWDTANRTAYVCPVPMCGVKIVLKRKEQADGD